LRKSYSLNSLLSITPKINGKTYFNKKKRTITFIPNKIITAGNSFHLSLNLKKLSAENKIIAPRIISYTGFGQVSTTFNPLNDAPINTPEMARQWVRANAKKGADGIKFFGAEPEIMKAALDENKKLGLGSACHHAQMSVARWNVLHSARAGLTSMEHWYGLPEALFEDKTVQNYPLNYNYNVIFVKFLFATQVLYRYLLVLQNLI